MRRPRLFALLATTALAAVAAAPAAAAPGDPLVLSGPADAAQLTAGVAVDLRARGVAGDSGLELRVSRTPAVIDACGRINAEVAQAPGTPEAGDPALFDFPTGRWFDQPGTYYWQVSRIGADGSCTATEGRRLTLTRALPPQPAAAAAERAARPAGARGALVRAHPAEHRDEQRLVIPDPDERRAGRCVAGALPPRGPHRPPPLAPAFARDADRTAAVRQRPLRGRLLDDAGAAGGARRHDHRAPPRGRAPPRPHPPRPTPRGGGARTPRPASSTTSRP